MTPDQTLKAALVGDAAPKRAKPAKAPRKPRAARPRRSSWVFRWGVKLMMIAMMLMISRGLMRAPEVQAMFADVRVAVIDFVKQERAARAMAAAAEQGTDPGDKSAAAGTQMPESRVAVRRVGAEPGARVLSGPADAVLAGNVLLVEGVPVVIEPLVCPDPATDRGESARAALEQLTRGQTLRCSVTGQVGKVAVKARCHMQGGLDLATAMQADRLCDAG
ncbi:MAG: hypothetical protein EP318_06730 [Rhodobacteraceae bacterium]|nr:MAG: hypothetical protein EP318_06730 [Paracoccaceae bacterium]